MKKDESMSKFSKDLPTLIETQMKSMGEGISKEMLVALRQMFVENPELWREEGELAEKAIETTINVLASSAFQAESVKTGLWQLKEDLNYEGSNAVERLLIQQVELAWVRLHFLEIRLTKETGGEHNAEAGQYWDQRVTMAQGRYTRALVALAKVRKLKLPDLQVNIAAFGGQQVNVKKS